MTFVDKVDSVYWILYVIYDLTWLKRMQFEKVADFWNLDEGPAAYNRHFLEQQASNTLFLKLNEAK